MRTAEERESLSFWNQKDIQVVFQVPYKVAKKAYLLADKLDQEELGEYRVYDTRVRSETVKKIMGIKKR